jgi:AcrR family transcriptional regulator
MILTGQFYFMAGAWKEGRAMARQDRRRGIMQAAEKLFRSRRFHEITTDDVAREAGVGKGTLYRYFRDKEDLFFQTATSGFDELCDLVRRRVSDRAPFGEQLLAGCRLICEFFERRKHLLRMIIAEDCRISLAKGSLGARWKVHRERLLAAVADIVRRGVGEGVIRDDLPADVLAQFLLGMLRTRARDLEGAPARMRCLEVVVDLFCRGAGRDAPPPARERGLYPSVKGTVPISERPEMGTVPAHVACPRKRRRGHVTRIRRAAARSQP